MGNTCCGCNCIRTCVSKKKKRLIISADTTDQTTGLHSHDGCDLDLSLVHKRIIAMGFPSSGVESCYRNPRDDVIDFLDENFGANYRVYNLCSESDRQYDPAIFHNRVCSSVQWPDHLPPTLKMLKRLILDDAMEFLKKDNKNVCAFHCKAGKGRTGTAVCCLLLATGAVAVDKNSSNNKNIADESLKMYGVARTQNAKGVTIASQKRYVDYFSRILPPVATTTAPAAASSESTTIEQEQQQPKAETDESSEKSEKVEQQQQQQQQKPQEHKNSKIRLTSLSVLPQYKYIHILKRDPDNGKTTQVLSLKKELVAENEQDEDEYKTWMKLPTVTKQLKNNNNTNDSSSGASAVEPMNETGENIDDNNDNADDENMIEDVSQVELSEDFCIAFGTEPAFPSKGMMMLWLHADFVDTVSSNNNDDEKEQQQEMIFKIGEVDGCKAYYEPSRWNEPMIKVRFTRSA